MRAPYAVCERHCRFYDHCAPTFSEWSVYRALHGRPCPLERLFADLACPFFMPGEREAELPKLEVTP
jgi:hypothetical protein